MKHQKTFTSGRGCLPENISLNRVAMKASRHKNRSSNKTADCTSVLYKRTFPHEIARRFSSARTKTEAIINSEIARPAIENSAVVQK